MLTASVLTPIWRNLLLAAANLVALLIYAIGLLSPLTPSEGFPTLVEILVFAGVPTVILAWCIRASISRLATFFFGLQLAAILGFSVWLLYLYAGPLNG